MSLNKLSILITAVVFCFFLQSCNEEPTNIGEELLDQDLVNVFTFDSAVDSIPITSSYYKKDISLGASSRLLVGKNGNVEASLLIRYNIVLADTLSDQILDNSVTVESAWLQFTRNYVYGADENPFNVSVFNILSPWTSSGFNSDSLATLQYAPEDQTLADTSNTRIDIQPQLALNWMKAAADTAIPADYGAFIKPSSTTSKINGYYAAGSDETVIPALYVVLRNQTGELDTLLYYTFADVGTVSGELPQLSNEYIAVQAGLEVVSKVRFDLSMIPESAIINNATLTLAYDSTKSVLGSNYINSLIAGMIVDSTTDSTGNSAILNNSGIYFTGDVTFIVQSWVRLNNSGLLISSSNRFLGTELYAIYGADAEPYLRPRLTITYTTKQ